MVSLVCATRNVIRNSSYASSFPRPVGPTIIGYRNRAMIGSPYRDSNNESRNENIGIRLKHGGGEAQ